MRSGPYLGRVLGWVPKTAEGPNFKVFLREFLLFFDAVKNSEQVSTSANRIAKRERAVAALFRARAPGTFYTWILGFSGDFPVRPSTSKNEIGSWAFLKQLSTLRNVDLL